MIDDYPPVLPLEDPEEARINQWAREANDYLTHALMDDIYNQFMEWGICSKQTPPMYIPEATWDFIHSLAKAALYEDSPNGVCDPAEIVRDFVRDFIEERKKEYTKEQ